MKILVIRNSAMGDVLLTLPVLHSFTTRYPEHRVTLLTSYSFTGLFTSARGLEIYGADYKEKYSGPSGLIKLFIDLRVNVNPDMVIDLHNVIRSNIVGLLFRMAGVPVFSVSKGRREKRDLISGKTKRQLPHTVIRYTEVFRKAGFDLQISGDKWLSSDSVVPAGIADSISDKRILVGVAPYAKHKLKMWPLEKMTTLLNEIQRRYGAKILLFGGGAAETEGLRKLAQELPDSIVVAGQMKIEEEIALIMKLNIMIAMDSSNMHMGALAGVPTVSIWGSTHPMTGFGAWGQPEDYSVQISEQELDCRPCTVYGKGECRRNDFACMNRLEPEMVFMAVEKVLGSPLSK